MKRHRAGLSGVFIRAGIVGCAVSWGDGTEPPPPPPPPPPEVGCAGRSSSAGRNVETLSAQPRAQRHGIAGYSIERLDAGGMFVRMIGPAGKHYGHFSVTVDPEHD